MIGELSNDHPVLFEPDKKYIKLGAGQSHILSQFNRFFIDEIECTLEFHYLSRTELDIMRQVRNRAFETSGIVAPDHRLPVIPLEEPVGIDSFVRNVHIYRWIGSGGYGNVGIGINRVTGEVRAVKTMVIRDDKGRRAVIEEAKTTLKLSVSEGIYASS